MMKNLIILIVLTASLVHGGTIRYYQDMTRPNLNWASVEIKNQLNLVVFEISEVSDATCYDITNAAGQNAASARTVFFERTYRGIQDFVEDRYMDFYPLGTNMIGGYTNETPSEIYSPYTNFTEFCFDAGMNSNGWRRATTNWPVNWTNLYDVAYTNGNAQAGDYFGPWIVDDLQLALDNMSRVGYDAAIRSPAAFTNLIGYRGDARSATSTFNEVVAACNSNWDTTTDNFFGQLTSYRLSDCTKQAGKAHFAVHDAHSSRYTNETLFTAHTFIRPIKRDMYSYINTFAAHSSGFTEDTWEEVYSGGLNIIGNLMYTTNVVGFYDLPDDPLTNPPLSGEFYQDGWVIGSAIMYVDFKWSYTRP